MSFEENFLYPLGLILAGGVVSGILIPFYTNKQKLREQELENLRKQREVAVEHERADYQFKIKLKEELLDLFNNYRQAILERMNFFSLQVATHYGSHIKKDENQPDKIILSRVTIPSEVDKQPKAIFMSEFN